eukprot:1452413-Karenia_brevis.AAC.1
MATQLRRWLRQDLIRVKERHLQGTSGVVLLQAATFLDPRFKLPLLDRYLSAPEIASARGEVKRLAILWSSSFPSLQAAQDQHNANPDNRRCIELVQPPRKKAKRAAKPRAPSQHAAVRQAAAQPHRCLKRADSGEEFLYGLSKVDETIPAPSGAVRNLVAVVEAEMERYDMEGPVQRLDMDPLIWWQEKEG